MASNSTPFPARDDERWVKGVLTANGQSARKYPHERAKIVLSGFVKPIAALRFPVPYQLNADSSTWYAYLVEHQEYSYEVWVIDLPGVYWEETFSDEIHYEVLIGGHQFIMTESDRSSILELLRLFEQSLEEARPIINHEGDRYRV